ncbi:MAG: ribosomal protein S18 [uncultured bacterium]|nr:MAG: ribosomal protein S18 [uncultured bacterium]KKQ57943.1 MAG: ribosomal protein S18, small subunit ribosomal protein S18 [Microgenomates group bacterium GW2011_GWC1_38_14]KKR94159.1 MAG: 30S ribosomal protein S18 [Candidatus Levybacteria bacterium GW2011_GWA2_41_15]
MAKKRRLVRKPKIAAPPKCFYCEEGKEPTFHDIQTLQRFLTERGKIISRARTGLCAKHQKLLTKNIKYARHLGLLPFVIR